MPTFCVVCEQRGRKKSSPRSSRRTLHAVIDNYVAEADPIDTLAQHKFRPVPVIVGNNADELTYLLPDVIRRHKMNWPPENDEDVAAQLKYFFGAHETNSILKRYERLAAPEQRS